jgi:hypothetical protein
MELNGNFKDKYSDNKAGFSDITPFTTSHCLEVGSVNYGHPKRNSVLKHNDVFSLYKVETFNAMISRKQLR